MRILWRGSKSMKPFILQQRTACMEVGGKRLLACKRAKRITNQQQQQVNMHSGKQQTSLTPELWTEVFAHVGGAQIHYRSWDDVEDDQQNQRQLHQLRLVCKQFNEVFATQPHFLKRLSLPEAFPSSSCPVCWHGCSRTRVA